MYLCLKIIIVVLFIFNFSFLYGNIATTEYPAKRFEGGKDAFPTWNFEGVVTVLWQVGFFDLQLTQVEKELKKWNFSLIWSWPCRDLVGAKTPSPPRARVGKAPHGPVSSKECYSRWWPRYSSGNVYPRESPRPPLSSRSQTNPPKGQRPRPNMCRRDKQDRWAKQRNFLLVVMSPHSYPSNYIRNAHKWCAVIGRPGSARPEGTPAMEYSFSGFYSKKQTNKQNKWTLDLKVYAHTCTQTKERWNQTHVHKPATWMNNTPETLILYFILSIKLFLYICHGVFYVLELS